MCESCVACRGVRCDQMSRDHFVRKNPPTFLSIAADAHAKLFFACATNVIHISSTGHCERHKAIGTGFQEFCRNVDVYIPRSTFVRIGSGRSPCARWGAGSSHGHCSEQD